MPGNDDNQGNLHVAHRSYGVEQIDIYKATFSVTRDLKQDVTDSRQVGPQADHRELHSQDLVISRTAEVVTTEG